MPNAPPPFQYVDLDQFAPAIAQGYEEAFARWMAAAEPIVRATLRSFARVVDTEAVLQESFLRVWQIAPRFVPDGRPNGLLRLCVRIARNLAVSERRRSARIDTLGPFPAAAYAAEDTAILERCAMPVPVSQSDPLLRRALDDCRSQLPDKPRVALAARLAAGVEPDDVLASRLQMRLNTFLQNVVRARKHMAECLKARGIDLDAEIV